MATDPLLHISRVTHHYGDFRAVAEADLAVEAGHVHCLLGPSGSGKSTLLRLTAGLEVLQDGEISVGGSLVAAPGRHVRPEQRSVGLVFQDYALFPHLSVMGNVVFGMPKARKTEQRGRALELLTRVGMDGHADAMPHTLSGGQQQRVALARALARRPSVMLLDEPFSGLDVRLREEVREATLEILKDAGVATLMVTHDPQEALKAGDAVSVIQEGKIVQTDSPREVYHRSVNRRVAEIFGPVNVLPAKAEGGQVPTVLGSLPTEIEGDCEVLVRPEDLRLGTSPYGSACKARITALEPGSGTLTVRLKIDREIDRETESAGSCELQALALARSPWQVEDTVYVSLEPGSAMIHRAHPRSDA